MKIPSVNESNLSQSLIVITPNTTDYGGITQMWEDGSAIAFCPLNLQKLKALSPIDIIPSCIINVPSKPPQ